MPIVQAGFEDIGWMLLEGLFIGILISKECKYCKTEKECIKAGCEWVNGKCIKRTKQTLTSK